MSETQAKGVFEQAYEVQTAYERGVRAGQISLDLGLIAMEFSRIERVPRYADAERENNAEHSYMLALVAPEICDALRLPLDVGLVSQYATVHDLIELETSDVPTFLVTEDEQLQKEINEQAALDRLMQRLPRYTRNMLSRYEAQVDPEARFVRYVDKLLPIVVDFIGAGQRVMREDYGVDTLEQLQACHRHLHERLVKKFGEEFPALDIAHELLCELFQTSFSQATT